MRIIGPHLLGMASASRHARCPDRRMPAPLFVAPGTEPRPDCRQRDGWQLLATLDKRW